MNFSESLILTMSRSLRLPSIILENFFYVLGVMLYLIEIS